MPRKTDLEQHICKSYSLILEYEGILQISSEPREKARCQYAIDEQWRLIEGYLDEYVLLHPDSRQDIPDDLVHIAVHFPKFAYLLSRHQPSTPPHMTAADLTIQSQGLRQLESTDVPSSFPHAPILRRTWVLLALLIFDLSLVILWGWCLIGDQPNLMAYLETVSTVVGVPLAILAIVFVTRRPIVLEDALRRLGTDKCWTHITLVLTGLSILGTLPFWPLGWAGQCTHTPTPIVAPMPSPPYFTYQVRVKVKDADIYLQGVKVTIEIGGKAPLNSITDSNGLARIQIPSSHIGKPGLLVAEKTGYNRHAQNIDIIGGTLSNVIEIELEPQRKETGMNILWRVRASSNNRFV